MISLTQSHTARRQDIAPKKSIGFKNCDHTMFGRKALVDEPGGVKRWVDVGPARMAFRKTLRDANSGLSPYMGPW